MNITELDKLGMSLHILWEVAETTKDFDTAFRIWVKLREELSGMYHFANWYLNDNDLMENIVFLSRIVNIRIQEL